MPSEWWAACVHIVCLIEGTGASMVDDAVHVFQAADREAAFQRALELGRQHETEYLNGEGQRVRWRLERVLTLDTVRVDSLDGAEVYSSLGSPDEVATFDAVFDPTAHPPGQTGI
jgi:hypothetical protein